MEYTKRVSSTCLIHLERNRYSVPASFANRPVSLRVYPDKLVVVAEDHVICEHPRIIDRTHTSPGRTMYGVPSKTHILNRLHRLIDGKPAAASVVTAPQALALANEPRADVERYDALRQDRDARHAS